MYIVTLQLFICLPNIATGVSWLPKHIPTEEDTINPVYHTVNDPDHLSNNPVKEPILSYAEVTILTKVKLTPNTCQLACMASYM